MALPTIAGRSVGRLPTTARHLTTRLCAFAGLFAISLLLSLAPVHAADPIKIGLSLSLTGATAPAGRQVQTGLEIWRDHVNAQGGLLGRPVELVYYAIKQIRRTPPASTPSSWASTKSIS